MIDQLWESHTFHTLLNDLFKARKNEEMGKIRLEAFLNYLATQGEVKKKPNEVAEQPSIEEEADLPVMTQAPKGPVTIEEHFAGPLAILKAKCAGKEGRDFAATFEASFPVDEIPRLFLIANMPFMMDSNVQTMGQNGWKVNIHPKQ